MMLTVIDQESRSEYIPEFIPFVRAGIVSKTLLEQGGVKQILFAMDAGQEISSHKAPYPATVHVLDGRLSFVLGEEMLDMTPGSWLQMPPNAVHSLVAPEPCRFLLTLIKGK